MPWESYITVKHQSALKRLAIDWPAHYCEPGCQETHVLPLHLPITLALQHDAKNIIKLKLGQILTGWTKAEQTIYQGQKVVIVKKFHRVYCDCTQQPQRKLLDLQHILSCKKYRKHLGDLQASYGHHIRSVIWDCERALEGPH